MEKIHNVENLSFDADIMRLFVDGKVYQIPVTQYSLKLAEASQEQKQHFVISPAGYGIHWPEIDEDLSIDGLIRRAEVLQHKEVY